MRSHRPRQALALITAEGFLGRLTFGMVSFALPLYAVSIGLSLGEVGLLVTIRTVVAIALKPLAGRFADRLGVRTVYLAGTLARVVAACVLLTVGSFVGLSIVRVLQGVSAAGRDVASLSVIARDAEHRIATAYSWYATAKHIGGVAGAVVAGALLAVTDGSFTAVFVCVLVLSAMPVVAAWFALRDAPQLEASGAPSAGAEGSSQSQPSTIFALLRELRGPATLGMLVATSAYMVHGLFPVLATEHAGLTTAQTGAVYSVSAAVFLVAGPAFGWAIDRYGYVVGTVWRSLANIGSSLLYMFIPNVAGFGVGRTLDDSGKAAFRPAWAKLVGDIANADPPRRSRRLSVLDTSETMGEACGPVLAGILWQTGGIAALFGVRILIAAAAELTAFRHGSASRPSSTHPQPAAQAG